MTEDVQIRNFVEKSKISKWPYLQFPCVQIQMIIIIIIMLRLSVFVGCIILLILCL